MATFQTNINRELLELELELIPCPRQPGNLRISKHACALRYCEAQRVKKYNTYGYGFAFIQKSGLEICRTCPDGRRYAKTL